MEFPQLVFYIELSQLKQREKPSFKRSPTATRWYFGNPYLNKGDAKDGD